VHATYLVWKCCWEARRLLWNRSTRRMHTKDVVCGLGQCIAPSRAHASIENVKDYIVHTQGSGASHCTSVRWVQWGWIAGVTAV
jgi:hypothetical protein